MGDYSVGSHEVWPTDGHQLTSEPAALGRSAVLQPVTTAEPQLASLCCGPPGCLTRWRRVLQTAILGEWYPAETVGETGNTKPACGPLVDVAA